ncbi:MAG: UvrD-helicase domain-containing protein [Lentimicrobium sp.]|nr:UvrD-helicase domain-containing protein [Lentimicrobium sp.]
MNKFLVYKSSAGSGKTYTLISVYLQIVLKEPSGFRNILAITFTNKAANEIKHRIISNLKMLSAIEGDVVPAKFSHMVSSLQVATGLSIAGISENAAKVLTLILHNYGDFAVSTIDSFMHRIIRSFSFDLKLSMNFEVEMDTALLKGEAVDLLLASVGTDGFITDILVKFVQERAESDESWQIERDLMKFSDNLFSEDAIAVLPHLNDFTAEKLAAVNRKLSKFITDFEESVKEPATQALKLVNNHGLDAALFFYGDKGIVGFFRKICNGDFLSASEPNSYVRKTIDTGEWLSAAGKKSPDVNDILAIADKLTDYYRKIELIAEEKTGKYLLYRNIRNNLYPMAVLGELNQRLQMVKKERNVVSIAEFNRIISSIVANEPVPFIYERTGERFRNYLIDEFQDTSVLQWQNLLPLVENSLSHGGTNMIVGDGKQAIYRFRNGEVEQFVKLPAIDNPQDNPIIDQRAKVLEREYKPNQLDSNYRSKREVIEFNNAFFEFAAKAFLPDFNQVYEGVAQKSNPENKGGQVQLEFIGGDAKADFDDNTCIRVLQLIGELGEAGFQPGEVTVLCRSNQDSSNVAAYLNNNGVKVVSSDSLLLQKSPEVNFLVNFLIFLNDEENAISRTALVTYLFGLPDEIKNDFHKYYSQSVTSSGFYNLLRQNDFDIAPKRFRGMSLYDTCEELIRIFRLHLKSPVYMQFFLDEVLKYSSGRNSAIDGFLGYWEQNNSKLSVVLPLSSDAVQIMTIHKSKGLEFPVVIYAFADDSMKLTRKSEWIELNDPELPELPVAMLKIDTNLESTVFSEVYTRENNKSRLDMLNQIYVAFTRAAERLYVLTKTPPKKVDELKSVPALIHAFLDKAGMYSAEKTIYKFGEGSVVGTEEVKKQPESVENLFLTNDWRDRLIFAGRAPRVWQAANPGGGQSGGNLLHLALSYIIEVKDVDHALTTLLQQGYVIENELLTLRAKLILVLGHPQVMPFFDGTGQVAAETEILAPGGKSFRPDRVIFHETFTDVIDYKAGKPLESHKSQIRKYASLLAEMGYPRVNAWLVYLENPVEVVLVN